MYRTISKNMNEIREKKMENKKQRRERKKKEKKETKRIYILAISIPKFIAILC